MDTSKEYILMCQQAKEIQELFKTTEPINYAASGSGHFIAHWYEENPEQKQVSCLEVYTHLDRTNWCLFRPGHRPFGSHTREKYTKSDELFIWLPRQDQLQEMIDKKWTMTFHLFVKEMTYEAGGIYFYGTLYERSMEQVWLMFIMKHNYNKKWNGEDWVSV